MVFSCLSKKRTVLEDGVGIKNHIIPLESGIPLIRNIPSNNRAEPVQSLGPIVCNTTPADVVVSPSCECLEPLVREKENGDLKYTLRCPTAGLFKCKFTSLMFKMKTAGEVEYHSVPWGNKLDDLHCEPAGPLYSISCFPGTPVQIHLPHCEVISDWKPVRLRVAHITGDGLEIIKPKEITESHVVIDVTGLSNYGLSFKVSCNFLFGRKIRTMVLPFLQTSSEPILHVLLLPRNMDIQEVKKKREKIILPQKEIYIDGSNLCKIHTRKKYSLVTDPTGLNVNPEMAKYAKCNPNFVPAFTVQCSAGKRVKLILKDGTKELWSSLVNIEGQHFIDKHRILLIESISMVEPILDRLMSKNVITQENYSHIRSKSTSIQRMRELFELGSIRSTTTGKDCLYDVLREMEPGIMEELKEMS